MRNDNWKGSTRQWQWMGCLAALVIVGCAPTKVETIQQHQGKEPLPKPDRVLVYDFAVSPKDVSLNSAVGAKLKRLFTDAPKSQEQLQVGQAVAKAHSEELVKQIQNLGMPAERASGSAHPEQKTLAIQGQFLTIDEGNRARRMVIGFGVGGTEVRTQVQVFLGTPDGPLLLQEFETSAESSKKPGMGPMVGVGAAATGAAATAGAASGAVGVGTEFNQTVEGDARRTAREVAKVLSRFFGGQGWIPKEKVSQ